MKREERSWGRVPLWAVTALAVCAVLLWYALDSGGGQAALSPLDTAAERTDTAPVDLNAATAEELDDLPGIGPVLAERIVAFREKEGSFRTPEDVMEVSGVGPALYEDIAPYIGAEQEDVEP